jgi:hypothetical protein
MKRHFRNGWGFIRITYKGKCYAWFGRQVEAELRYSNWLAREQMV